MGVRMTRELRSFKRVCVDVCDAWSGKVAGTAQVYIRASV